MKGTESMKTNTQRPGGLIVPVLTPLTESGKVDEAAQLKLITRCIEAGADAIFVGGSAGMGPMLTDAQWEHALASAVAAVGEKALLFSGIIAPSTQRALQQIEVSRRAGCKAIVVTPTFYITLTRPAEMIAHFQAGRDATDQELIVYNIPSCTNSSIPVEVIRHAAEQGWTRSVKESSGDRDYFASVLNAIRGLDVAVLQGNEPDICWGLKSGAAGIVPVCANCEPETCAAAVRAAKEQDWSALELLQERIDLVRDTILVGDHNWISGLFCALNVLGIGNGKPLLPLQEVDHERRDRISAFFEGAAV